MNQQAKKAIVIFVATFLFLWLLDILLPGQLDVTISIKTAQTGRIDLYYAERGESFSAENMTSFTIESGPEQNGYPISLKVGDSSSNLRIDPEAGLEEFDLSKISLCFGIIPLAEITAEDIATRLAVSNMDIQSDGKTATLIATDADPTIVFSISLFSVLLLLLIKCIIYTAVAVLITLALLRLKRPTITTVFAAMVIAILTIPSAVHGLLGIESDASLENAMLAEQPTFSITEIATYPKEYEDYYNDHIPFKPQIIEAHSLINYHLFNKSSTSKVLLGNDGWGYLASTLEDYEKTNLFTEQELLDITECFNTIQQYLSTEGIELYIYIPPNKVTIYDEHLPNGYLPTQGKSRVEQLVEQLRTATDITVIYEPEIMLQHSSQHQLYYKMDTHWNAKGAYLGLTTLTNELGIKNIPDFEDMTFNESPAEVADLFDAMGIDIATDDIGYTANFMPQIEVVEQYNSSPQLPIVQHFTSNSTNEQRLLLFRDSYGIELEQTLPKLYGESYFVWQHFDMSYVWEYQPDIVVIETVERLIDQFLLVNDNF